MVFDSVSFFSSSDSDLVGFELDPSELVRPAVFTNE
jgi:hypothetical protein